MKLEFKLFKNGTFCIIANSKILIDDGFPHINGRPARVEKIQLLNNQLVYFLSSGCIKMTFEYISTTCFCIKTKLEKFKERELNNISVFDAVGKNWEGIYQSSGEIAQDCGYLSVEKIKKISPIISRGIVTVCTNDEVLVSYVTDHTRFHQQYCLSNDLENNLNICASFRIEKENHEDITLPIIYFDLKENIDIALETAATAIGTNMKARIHQDPAYHWCSWYYNYSEFNQEQLSEYLREFNKIKSIEKFKYFQIDAGYSSALGDWLSPREYWPKGLKSAIEEIQMSGYLPGIWIGPFMVGNRSKIANQHPDWLLRDRDKNIIIAKNADNEPRLWGYHDEEYYILDTSHPDAMEYLKSVFRTMRSWGIRLFKTDFMLWGYQDSSKVCRYAPGKTSVEYFTDVLKMIRQEIGEDSYWLGCIAPFYPFIGYADAMRVSGDVGSSWNGEFNPLNMIKTVQGNYYTNYRYYQNDPDSIFFRDFHIRLTDSEIEALALYSALSGGCTYTSDPIHLLRDDRKELLSFIRPNDDHHIPCFPYKQEERDDIVITYKNTNSGKGLLFVFNPTDQYIIEEYNLSKIGFKNEVWVCERDGYNSLNADLLKITDKIILKTQPHSSRLFVISEKDSVTFCDDNLWSNLL